MACVQECSSCEIKILRIIFLILRENALGSNSLNKNILWKISIKLHVYGDKCNWVQ